MIIYSILCFELTISHLIVVPPGVQPADALQSSNLMESRRNANQTSSGDFDDYGGIDPSMDPELAMAIRVSTEEARAREEARVLLNLQTV